MCLEYFLGIPIKFQDDRFIFLILEIALIEKNREAERLIDGRRNLAVQAYFNNIINSLIIKKNNPMIVPK